MLLAYAYEKPVVATTEGEFLTVVDNGETGLLVPAGDAKSLADAIIWYLEHPDEAQRFAAEGKKVLTDRLSWDAIGAAVKKAYE